MAASTSLLLLHHHLLQFAFSALCLFILMQMTKAQVTDPTEVSALNTIFQRWGIHSSSSWNTTGDPCTGAALNSTNFDLSQYNPIITCDCTTNSTGTICHITQLKVYAQDVIGSIPQELQVFKRLRNLNLAQNYLTGPVPAFFGNFTEMQYMSFGINALTGPIPKELGNLKKLIVLGMGTNYFNGTIPPEFGGMTNLEQWYMDSSGLSGHLPSELSNLKKLQKIWASDNNFTGKLPDFIGSLTNLTDLRLQGNYFQGPIPASFSNLTKLSNLRIGDIVNGTSTLQFISNMPSLSILILRNCKISGELPSKFSQYSNLLQLDLSFNNITGSVPQSLFSLTRLNFLFLGNNSLSGTLPAQKSSALTSVDLSYNKLAGSFPSWVADSNLQLNLVANNFVIDNSNISGLTEGLNCLQRDKPCFRDSPIYSSFAVKCGGSRTITASDEVLYEIDNVNLTSASYYVTNPTKWGVSSVGIFVDSPNANNYKLNDLNQFQKTLDSELFQTSRLSPSSLRYYGMGLENGNYTVKLQFAEVKFIDGFTWKSVGRRIFDIYIQGDLKEKDFDIRKEAGGNSFTAVGKVYTTLVTNNFLEIHFFWAGKGTCCVPYQGYYGPSISAISVSPDFTPTVSNKPPGSSSTNHTGLAVGLAVGAVVLALAILCLILLQIRRKRILKEEYESVLQGMDVKPDIFGYAEMKMATEDFSSSNLLGEGGYGPVFKGKLSDGRIIAVKQLSVTSHQGKQQFLTEIATISTVRHRNLVKLHGCCVEGDKRILVYEFLENKSLDQAIFGKSILHLDWPKRFDICLGVARGLAYLHEESSMRIVHRDVKASNVLLDADLNPKISDFGLAKLYDENKTHVSTKVAGTIGYLAPEYAMRGHLTEKADVYAFGVLSLEILAGRPNSDQSLDTKKIYLLEWAWYLHEKNRELELVDGSLSSYNKDEVHRVIRVALLCTQASPAQRPPMSRVVGMLTGDIEVTEVTTKPSYLADWQNYKDVNSSYVTDYTSTSTQVLINSQLTKSSSAAGAGKPRNISSTPLIADSLMNRFIDEGR